VSDCFEKCFPIREFASCQGLLDVAEEIRSQKAADQVSIMGGVLFSPHYASEIPKSLSPYAGMRYRHGQAIVDRFHRPEFYAIRATGQGYQ
jgi:hypothetical protein